MTGSPTRTPRPLRSRRLTGGPSAFPRTPTATEPGLEIAAARVSTPARRPEASSDPDEARGSRGWELTLFRHLNYPGTHR